MEVDDNDDDNDHNYEEITGSDDPETLITFEGKLELKVYKASILKINVDAIVNAANEGMAHGGGVAAVISEAAGREMDKECYDYVRKEGSVKAPGNIVTSAGKLKRYKGVIHAVGPTWYSYR